MPQPDPIYYSRAEFERDRMGETGDRLTTIARLQAQVASLTAERDRLKALLDALTDLNAVSAALDAAQGADMLSRRAEHAEDALATQTAELQRLRDIKDHTSCHDLVCNCDQATYARGEVGSGCSCKGRETRLYAELQLLRESLSDLKGAVEDRDTLRAAIDPRGAISSIAGVVALAEAHRQDSETVDAVTERVAALQADLTAATAREAALRKFVVHRKDCWASLTPMWAFGIYLEKGAGPCSCGLAAILDAHAPTPTEDQR